MKFGEKFWHRIIALVLPFSLIATALKMVVNKFVARGTTLEVIHTCISGLMVAAVVMLNILWQDSLKARAARMESPGDASPLKTDSHDSTDMTSM